MRTFTLELALAGLLVISSGCNKDGDTSETGQETGDTEVPTTETDCNDGDDNDQDGDEDCADSDCAGEAECMFTISSIGASGSFVYDATNDEITGGVWGGTAVPPLIEISLTNQDFASTKAEEDTCVIDIVYTGTDAIQPEAWDISGAGSYLGFIMPEGKYDVTTNCESLDEETLGTVEAIAASGWGVGVGPEDGDITDAIDAAVTAGDIPTGERVFYFGGGFYWGMTGVPDPFMNQSYANAFEVDADFNVLNDAGDIASSTEAPALISSVDVFGGALPPTGFYQTQTLGVWAFQ